jgi:rod shape-determining protein MreD
VRTARLQRTARNAALVALAGVILVIAVLLQVTIATDLTVLGGRPDLVVIVVVSLALLRGPVAGAAAGFAGGFLLDCLGLGAIGTTSLTLTLVGYAVGVRGERLRRRAVFRPLMLVAAASIAAALGELVVAVLVGSGPSISSLLFFAALPTAMLNVLVAIPILPLMRRLFAPQEQRTAVVDLHTTTVVA